MPLLAIDLQTRYQRLIAPDDLDEFLRLLQEADERLLTMGRWHWVRKPLVLTITDNQVVLPSDYESIVGARVNGKGIGVKWEESEWFEGGPGEAVPIEGAQAALVDMGLVDDERVYKVTTISEGLTEVEVLARYKALAIYDEHSPLRCPAHSALKQMMYALLHENANNPKAAEEYRALARRELDEREAAYRGTANQVYKPSLTQPLRRTSKSNFP